MPHIRLRGGPSPDHAARRRAPNVSPTRPPSIDPDRMLWPSWTASPSPWLGFGPSGPERLMIGGSN